MQRRAADKMMELKAMGSTLPPTPVAHAATLEPVAPPNPAIRKRQAMAGLAQGKPFMAGPGAKPLGQFSAGAPAQP